jgi:hypothetical protein
MVWPPTWDKVSALKKLGSLSSRQVKPNPFWNSAPFDTLRTQDAEFQKGCIASQPSLTIIEEENAMDTIYGLTESEAQVRRKQGLGNDAASGSSRSYWDIARANLFTLFNNILFVLGVALVFLGWYSDALTSVGLGLINLCHLKEHNHSRRFYELLNRVMPDWQKKRQRLNELEVG